MTFLIFDVETRVDKALLRSTLFRGQALSDEQAYERMREQLWRESDGRSGFFPHTLHVPISIALGSVRDDYVLEGVDVLRADVSGEAELVREFWRRLETFDGTLVSFNGRTFDLPVLELQALRHTCSAPRYFGERNGLRTRHGRHWDLYDWITNGGASRLRGGFDLIAKLAGLPGKGEFSGADVQMLWERRRWDDIHRYCASDVVQTYFVFLRIEHLRGRLSGEDLARVEAAVQSFRRQLDDTLAGGAAPLPGERR